jgi:hypothetical protein
LQPRGKLRSSHIGQLSAFVSYVLKWATQGAIGADCDWGGAPWSSLSDGHLDQFREYCIEWHGLNPNDTEPIAWFDLEALTLTLLEPTILADS